MGSKIEFIIYNLFDLPENVINFILIKIKYNFEYNNNNYYYHLPNKYSLYLKYINCCLHLDRSSMKLHIVSARR